MRGREDFGTGRDFVVTGVLLVGEGRGVGTDAFWHCPIKITFKKEEGCNRDFMNDR